MSTMPGEAHDDGRVDHRGLDLAAQGLVGLELVGGAQERVLEHAAGLAGARHGDEERVEDLGVALERVGERQAGLDVLADLLQRLGERLAVGLASRGRRAP
jgi:hypothetical protein